MWFLGGVFCVDYCFDLVESEVFTFAFLGTGTEAAVHVLAGIPKNDTFSFRFVEGDHDTVIHGFLIDSTERLDLSLWVLGFLVKGVALCVEEVDEADEVFFGYSADRNELAFVSDESADGVLHQIGACSLSFCFVTSKHVLKIGDEVGLLGRFGIAETELAVLHIDNRLGFDCLGESELLFVPCFIPAAFFWLEVNV